MNIRENEQGALNILLIPLILSVLMLLGAIGFGYWSYAERTSYKEKSDEKVAAAVKVAVERTKSEKDNEFIQREKEPLRTYESPSQYGSFTLKYPKTWSVMSIENNDEFELKLHPHVVPDNKDMAYGLRVEVINKDYNQVVERLEGDIKKGELRAAAYKLPKVSDVVGLRVDGQVDNDKTGAAVYMPLRDKTIVLVTETPERVGDFNNIILPNFEFRP